MSLADQSKLAGLANKFEGRTPIRVYFLDNSSKVFLLNTQSTTVHELLEQCLEKLGMNNPAFVLPYFGIFESRNGGAIDGVLPLESTLQDALNSWKDGGVEKTAKFLFMIRLFMPSINGLSFHDEVAHQLRLSDKALLDTHTYLQHAQVVDEAALHLQFIQAVYHVITAQIPTSAEEALLLGALHFLMKFGRFRAQSHKPGFLGNRIVEFVPMKLLKTAGTTLVDWEAKLLAKAQALSQTAVVAAPSAASSNRPTEEDEDAPPAESDDGRGGSLEWVEKDGRRVSAQRKYLETVYALSTLYGVTFFKCTQRSSRALPDSMYLGIHHGGIRLLDKHKKPLRDFSIEELFRWGFKPNTMFYFEVSADNELGTGSLEFETDKGKAISDLMTDYALAFLKEREREEERAKRRPALGLASNMGRLHLGGGAAGDNVLTRGSAAPLYHGKSAEFRAAVRIQAAFRGYSLRSEWVREDAVLLLQSVWRGYRARVQLGEMIEQMIQNGEL